MRYQRHQFREAIVKNQVDGCTRLTRCRTPEAADCVYQHVSAGALTRVVRVRTKARWSMLRAVGGRDMTVADV